MFSTSNKKEKRKKAVLSALLINRKKKPYHIPQSPLFTNENNNEAQQNEL